MRKTNAAHGLTVIVRSRLRAAMGRASPTMLILEPTLRCNSRCLTCYNRDKLNSPCGDLDADTCRRIAADLPDLLVLELSGGEPSLHPDLPRIVAGFAAATPVRFVSIPTNALLPERIERMTREVCGLFDGSVTVGLSIDGIGAAHDRVRGVAGNFESLVETHDRLAVLRRQTPNLHLSANTCLCAHNEGTYRDVLDWVASHWPDVEGHSISLVRGAAPDGVAIDCAAFLAREGAYLGDLARRRAGYRFGLAGRMNRLFWAAYYREALRFHRGLPRRWACSAGGGSLYVDALGGVHACELRDPIGSLRDQGTSLRQILRSKPARAERSFIRRRGCSCDHSCFLQHSAFTMASNAGLWLRGLAGGGRRERHDART